MNFSNLSKLLAESREKRRLYNLKTDERAQSLGIPFRLNEEVHLRALDFDGRPFTIRAVVKCIDHEGLVSLDDVSGYDGTQYGSVTYQGDEIASPYDYSLVPFEWLRSGSK